MPREGLLAIVVKVYLKLDGRIAWAEPLDFIRVYGPVEHYCNDPFRAGIDSA